MTITEATTPADLEAVLLEILRENRPGKEVHGCHGHLEIYDRAIQKQIIEPLWRARAAAGLIGEIDDLGHRTEFAAAWNRAVQGKPGDWDCRSLALPFVRAACRDIPDFFDKVMSDKFDGIDEALLRHLPEILAGPGLTRPATCQALKSWVDGDFIWFCMEGPQIRLCDKSGQDISPPAEIPAFIDLEPVSAEQAEIAYLGLMSFHGTGVDYDDGQKAWQAWRDAAEAEKILRRDSWESMTGLAWHTVLSKSKLGFASQQLRQDECVSVEVRPDGFVVYRGSVAGLPEIVDEGQFFCGPRAAFTAMLEKGGFAADEAEAYLDRLVSAGSAFAAIVPAGSTERILIDAETLYAFDADPDEMVRCENLEEARPILAVGTFELPDMPSHRARAALSHDPEDVDLICQKGEEPTDALKAAYARYKERCIPIEDTPEDPSP